MRFILILLIFLFPVTGWTEASISSAKLNRDGSIQTGLSDGRVLTVPNDMGNRDRRALQQWVDTQGGIIQAADPVPEPARLEKIRRDPFYPTSQEFLEAQIHCRYDLDCSALDAIRSRILELESKYP